MKPDTWRFELRQNVKFHNGNPFTADDVVASITRLLDPGARARGNIATVVRAEKVDDFTVDIVTNGPYPLLLNDLAGIYILDKEWMEANGALKPGNIATGVTTAASTNAIGTGPFKVESYKPDAGTTFVVNPDWWDKPQHNLTRIEFKPVKSDATRVAALLSGELDLIAPAPLQDLQRIGASSGLQGHRGAVAAPDHAVAQLPPRAEGHAGAEEPAARPQGAPGHVACHRPRDDQEARDARQVPQYGTLVAPPVPGYAKDNDKLLRPTTRTRRRSSSPKPAIRTASRRS